MKPRMTLAAFALAMAGAAQAAPPALAPLPSYGAVTEPASRPAMDLSEVRTPRALSFAQANALRAAGLAQTAVDHRFARKDLVGSVGFLCGLQPGANSDGAASALGVDPQGRFLGAKLSYAFR
jgi:hypothetical protein